MSRSFMYKKEGGELTRIPTDQGARCSQNLSLFNRICGIIAIIERAAPEGAHAR